MKQDYGTVLRLLKANDVIYSPAEKYDRVYILTILPSLFASDSFSSQLSLVVMRCTFPPANSTLWSESSPSFWGYIYESNYNFYIRWIKRLVSKPYYIDLSFKITSQGRMRFFKDFPSPFLLGERINWQLTILFSPFWKLS